LPNHSYEGARALTLISRPSFTCALELRVLLQALARQLPRSADFMQAGTRQPLTLAVSALHA
jgi:hypothetical protein